MAEVMRRESTDFDERVLALWPSESTLIDIGLEDLITNLDELWFPSSDDIWVLNPSAPKFLLLDHEEMLLAGDLELVSALGSV